MPCKVALWVAPQPCSFSKHMYTVVHEGVCLEIDCVIIRVIQFGKTLRLGSARLLEKRIGATVTWFLVGRRLVSQKLSRASGNLISPGIEPGPWPTDHESNALPLRQTTFGVSDTPDFHIFNTRRESNPDCQRKTSSVRRIRKIKRRRAPGVGFEPTRNAWSRISIKRPHN